MVYSLAYGDQPALICDLVDWARAAGFPVVAAGRGHKWLPHFAQSTPETVWGYYGLTPEQARIGGLNPEDVQLLPRRLQAGDRDAPRCATPPASSRRPTACSIRRPRSTTFRSCAGPIAEGGVLHHKGQVEVISSLERDGTPIPYDIRFGVFVVFEGDTEYIRNCFKEYMVRTDP